MHYPRISRWLYLAGLFLLVEGGFLPSCTMITEQDFLALNDRVVSLNARVKKLEGAVDKKLAKQVDSKIEPVRANQAEIVADLDRIKEQLQDLSGKVEENGLLIRRSVEKDTTAQDVMKAQMAELSKRIESLEAQVQLIQSHLGLQKPAETTAGKPVAALEGAPGGAETAKPGVMTEQQVYDQAMELFKEGKYEKSIVTFRDFLNKYPTSDLADNAQFWIGQSYMEMKQYEKAILAFQDVIKKYPDGNKVPNAMLKQALAFYEIKDKVSARLILKKIIRKYPESEEAKIARAKLKAIK